MLADINGNLADLRSEAAMASQRFCLRWNNHQSNLLSVFDQLLHDESFVDVTLAVEGHLLKAHKMVLSACSPYFQALFVGHPDKHPIVILKDVPYADMRSLLDFMYRGEVSVDQDRLTAFLRVAESLRIKGLTEVNEDKCDLPSITSSLLGNQNAGPPPPPPNLHRINQLGHHHHQMLQKRYHHMSSHPLLGSALTAPKRKRGRPRKLSGSSDTPMDTGLSHEQQCSDLVQGSPEMMEMKMGLDFQSETTGHNSSTGSAGSNGSERQSSKRGDLEAAGPTENGTDQPAEVGGLLTRIKGEPEPTPSTSAQAKDEEFTRPHSRQGSESYKQDFTQSSCGSSSSSIKSEFSENTPRGMCTPEKPSTPHQYPPATDSPRPASAPNHPSTPTTPSSGANASSNPSNSSANSNAASQNSIGSNNGSGGNNNSSSTNLNSNNNNSSNNTPSTTPSPRPNFQSPATTAPSSPASGAMSAPTGRQVPKRRIRRRAASQSQDPAEQLTEMSVRGLNLFRYASISEGVYQCTECAKVDIQKTFKNKYSFQRHAFLYHEGHQRKVFPCPVCGKEFSRPDKMKNHMKTVHDCFMPKDCVMPYGFFLPP